MPVRKLKRIPIGDNMPLPPLNDFNSIGIKYDKIFQKKKEIIFCSSFFSFSF